MLYFDHNATTSLSLEARTAWLETVDRYIGNPSSPHRLGARADRALEDARGKLGTLLGVKPGELVWTAGATEANNTVVRHFATTGGGEAVVSAIEHPSMLRAVQRYYPERHATIPVLRSGVADLDWLADRLNRSRPDFVALMAANNETGVLQPWREAQRLCAAAGVPFVCDASQWIGKLPAQDMNACDVLIGCAHKFGGPQSVGFFKAPHALSPFLVGGKQEGGRRAGTENLPGAVATVAALEGRECALRDGAVNSRRQWRDQFIAGLTAELTGVIFPGGSAEVLWNTVSVIMPAADCRQRWVVKLDKHGAAVSSGSACASGQEEPSHVLTAMGIPSDAAGRVVRISSGWETSWADWQALLKIIQETASEILDAAAKP